MKKILYLSFAICQIILIISCKKEAIRTTPIITTLPVSNITETSAMCGGNATSDGGEVITIKGICWSVNQNPTISDNKSTNGTGVGNFSYNIEGLTENTTYYIRAYATNMIGTSYGDNVSLTTKPLTDIDGNIYNTIKIGTQVWMASNLKTTKYNDGSIIPNVINGFAWMIYYQGAYCDYNNYSNNSNLHGRLYNWYSTNSGKLCPKGWHVPSYDEWDALITFLGGSGVAGGKLKSTGTTTWQNPNLDANNSSGFNAQPGGCRYEGTFNWYGQRCDLWSSTEYSSQYIWTFSLMYDRKSVFIGYMSKPDGLSIRCIKD